MTEYEADLNFARELALEVGELLRRGSGQVRHLRTKDSHVDLLTEYDLRSEELILERIRDHDPGSAILAEESGQHGSGERMWVVDPVDGTTNFAHGLSLFCVSIALQQAGEPVVGVVYAPLLDELFTAAAGQGARLNGDPISVSNIEVVKESLVVTGFPYGEDDKRAANLAYFGAFSTRAQAVRRLGSAALDLCYVAAGRLDAYWEIETMPWDASAGALLVREAGGRVTTLAGGPLTLTAPTSVLASNDHIHQEVLDIMEETKGRIG